jgi:hypothetical protein
MSIADDPFFRGFPQASRDRIKEAEFERESIIQKGYEAALEIEEAFGRSEAVLEEARQRREAALEEGDRRLVNRAIAELWEQVEPDFEAFRAKARQVWRLIHGSNSNPPEQAMRHWLAVALRLRAASEEADSHPVAQSSPNKAAAARSRTESAVALRRMICEMKSAKYSHQEMCRALDERGIGTPEHANWGDHNWSGAFRDPKYKPRVKKYLSHVTSRASA